MPLTSKVSWASGTPPDGFFGFGVDRVLAAAHLRGVGNNSWRRYLQSGLPPASPRPPRQRAQLKNLSGADAHHVASALEAGCEELITFDTKIRNNAAKIATLGLRVTTGDQTRLLPPEPPTDKPKVSAADLGQDDLFAGLEVDNAAAESELEPSDEPLPPEVAE